MKRRYIIRRAGRSLKHAKIRTLLTSLAIAVGAFTLTLSIAAGEGSRQYADKLISSNIDPQTLLITKDKTLFGNGAAQQPILREYDPDAVAGAGEGIGSSITIKRLTASDMDKLRKIPELTNVYPVNNVSIQYLTFEGIDKKFIGDAMQYDPGIRADTLAGSLPPLGTNIDAGDLIVPEGYLSILKLKAADLIGKKVTLTIAKPMTQPTQAEIDQILETKGVAGLVNLTKQQTKEITLTVRAITQKSVLSFSGSSGMQISDTRAQEITDYTTKGTPNYQKYMIVSAKAKQGTDPEIVKQQLGDKGYDARTAKDMQDLLFMIVNILQGIVAGFGILALLASVFGIINTQYISVLERTQQIGLMKALGMRQRDVAKLFRYEAAWIGFLGGVIGAGLAWGIGTALNPWITKELRLGDGNALLVFQPLPIIGLIITLMVIAIVAGYWPARKAAKLDPIEALRTE